MKLAIGLRGVHSLMTFFTLCANLGRPCAISVREPFADLITARMALDATAPADFDAARVSLADRAVARAREVLGPGPG